MFKRIACCAAAAMLLATSAAWAEDPYANVWTEILASDPVGVVAMDYAGDLAVDNSGCSYITGQTKGSISGGTGSWFTVKYDTDGTLLWAQQIDLGAEGGGYGIDVYGDDVYVIGDNVGCAYVTKLDAATGAIDNSFGTSGVLTLDSSSSSGGYAGDRGNSIAIAGSNSIYAAGNTSGLLFSSDPGVWGDAYLAKLDSSGNVTWGVQYGADGDTGPATATSVSISSDGGAFVCGMVGGNLNGQTGLGGSDGYAMKVSSSGSTVWTTLVGDSDVQYITSCATDYAGDLFVGGPEVSDDDGFVGKLDGSTGTVLWTQQISSGVTGDEVNSVAVDCWGDVYVVGTTEGSLFGTIGLSTEVFFAKYDGDTGDLVWGLQFGEGQGTTGVGVDADLVGDVYLCGTVNTTKVPLPLDFFDVLVAKYSGDNGKYLPGDANCDGTVDISDLTVLSQNWEDYSEVKTWAQGNFNGDDYVDISDLTILGQYWGLSTSSFEEALASIGTVPEPATFAMLIAGLVGLVAYAWRKR